MNYVPQLASYYATADAIDFVVVGLSESELVSIKDSLKLLELGDNVSISFVSGADNMRFDYTVDSTIKPFDASRQLSLFDLLEGE